MIQTALVVNLTIGALERIGPAAKQASPRLRDLALSKRPSAFDTARYAIKALAGFGDYEGVIMAGSIDDFAHEQGLADVVRAYDFDVPGLAQRLAFLLHNGLSDYVRESAAIGLARVAPRTPGLVALFSPRLEKLSTELKATNDEGARAFYSGQIKQIRGALSRIGTTDANDLLRRFPEAHGPGIPSPAGNSPERQR